MSGTATETVPITALGLLGEPEEREDGWHQLARITLAAWGAQNNAETVDSDLGPYKNKGDLEKLAKREPGELYAVYVDGAWEGISDSKGEYGTGDLADSDSPVVKRAAATAKTDPVKKAAGKSDKPAEALPATGAAKNSAWAEKNAADEALDASKKATPTAEPAKKAAK